jgi:hypothetical protein
VEFTGGRSKPFGHLNFSNQRLSTAAEYLDCPQGDEALELFRNLFSAVQSEVPRGSGPQRAISEVKAPVALTLFESGGIQGRVYTIGFQFGSGREINITLVDNPAGAAQARKRQLNMNRALFAR